MRQSGRRDLSQIGLIVIHCTQSNSARSSAQWFENTRAQGSAHLVVDDVECYRTLDNEVIPWGAKGANTRILESCDRDSHDDQKSDQATADV